MCFDCFLFMCRRYNIYFEGDFVLWKSTGCRDIEVCEGILMQHVIVF